MTDATSPARCGTARRLALLAGVLTVTTTLTACTAVTGDTPQPTGASSAPQATAVPEAPTDEFGPNGFGQLTLGMTEEQALATGDLGTSPVSVDAACKNYSFKGGPAPDPASAAAEAKLQKEYEALQRAAGRARGAEPPPNASAEEFADSARAHADSAETASKLAELDFEMAMRAAERTEAFTGAGGASFAAGTLRTLVAPPEARTAAGIARGSTVEQLEAAYRAQGLRATDEYRFEFPAPGQPEWSFTFDVVEGKVAYFMLRNSSVLCD